MSRYEGRLAVITGGGKGIGRSICKLLAKDGSVVAVVDIDEAAAAETVVAIEHDGGAAMPYICDVTNHEQVSAIVAAIEKKAPIDILVNNAGIAHIGNVESTSEAALDRLYAVNVKGLYNFLNTVIPSMKGRGQGVIVNMASIAASLGLSDRFAYSMTKGAVKAMTLSVARDYIDYGIRCNCVSPARVHTPFVDNYLAEDYADNREEMFEKLSKSQPIGRMGTPQEVASLVAYLCSDDAAFITGSDFPIDGGFVTLNT